MKLFIQFLRILCISIPLLSCTEKKPSEPTILNDIFQLQQSQINSFDPVDAYHAGHIHMVKQIYNTLADVDLKGKTIPSLATSWETTDGTLWTFHLRKNVLFSEDGCFDDKSEQQFVAGDVKYTFERLLAKDSKSLGVSYFSNIIGFDKYRAGEAENLEGITVADQNNIVFRLAKPDFNFPSLLTLPYASIVKKKAVDTYGEKFKLHPVGTGPFTLVSFESNQKVVLAKNKSYWEENGGERLPFVDGVTVYLTTDNNLSFLMFKNQKSDFLELNLPLQQQLESTTLPFPSKTETIQWTQLNFYLFNLKRVSDPNVRLGINAAIDRNRLQSIIKNQGVVATSLFPGLFSELAAPHISLKFTPQKAASLLQGKRTLNLVCFEDVLSRALAEEIARQLVQYGIDLKIEAVTFPVLVERLTAGKYDLIQIYWGPLYADAGHFLNPFITSSFPPSGNNFNQYSNPEFDTLVENAAQLPVDQQAAEYLKAQNVILSDMPFLLVYYKNLTRVSNNKFSMPMHPLGYRLYKLANAN